MDNHHDHSGHRSRGKGAHCEYGRECAHQGDHHLWARVLHEAIRGEERPGYRIDSTLLIICFLFKIISKLE